MPRGNSAQTRQRLLEAGHRLAHAGSLAALRVDDIVEAAGVAKGTFYLHFEDRSGFLVALHLRFHDKVRARISAAVARGKPGLPRLLQASLEYLDACREQAAVKALLIESRTEPAIHAEVAKQNAAFSQQAEMEFTAARWPQPDAAAKLWVGLIAEIALAEAEARKVLPALRSAVKPFLGLAARKSTS